MPFYALVSERSAAGRVGTTPTRPVAPRLLSSPASCRWRTATARMHT